MFAVQQFISDCVTIAARPAALQDIEARLSAALANPDNVLQAMTTLRPPEVAGDAILFRSSTLFILDSWLSPHFMVAPHDHGMWAVIGIYQGQEDNVFYARQNESLHEVERQSIRPSNVISLDSNAIHAISNPLDKPALALHIYGGDILTATRSMWNPFTMEESPFEGHQFMQYSREMMSKCMDTNTIIQK